MTPKAPPLSTASPAEDSLMESFFEISQMQEILYGTLPGNRGWKAKGWLFL